MQRSNPYVTNIRGYQKCGTVHNGANVAYAVPHCAPNVLDIKSSVNIAHKNCRYRSTLNRNMALLIW
jgi:hypothetical protein